MGVCSSVVLSFYFSARSTSCIIYRIRWCLCQWFHDSHVHRRIKKSGPFISLEKFITTNKKVLLVETVVGLKSRTVQQLLEFDVIIVTFRLLYSPIYQGRWKTLAQEVSKVARSDHYKELADLESKGKITETIRKTTAAMLEKHGETPNFKWPMLEQFYFRRLCFDEYHDCSEISDPRPSRCLLALKAHVKWGLTGTPPIDSVANIRSLGSIFGADLVLSSEAEQNLLDALYMVPKTTGHPADVIHKSWKPTLQSLENNIVLQSRELQKALLDDEWLDEKLEAAQRAIAPATQLGESISQTSKEIAAKEKTVAECEQHIDNPDAAPVVRQIFVPNAEYAVWREKWGKEYDALQDAERRNRDIHDNNRFRWGGRWRPWQPPVAIPPYFGPPAPAALLPREATVAERKEQWEGAKKDAENALSELRAQLKKLQESKDVVDCALSKENERLFRLQNGSLKPPKAVSSDRVFRSRFRECGAFQTFTFSLSIEKNRTAWPSLIARRRLAIETSVADVRRDQYGTPCQKFGDQGVVKSGVALKPRSEWFCNFCGFPAPADKEEKKAETGAKPAKPALDGDTLHQEKFAAQLASMPTVKDRASELSLVSCKGPGDISVTTALEFTCTNPRCLKENHGPQLFLACATWVDRDDRRDDKGQRKHTVLAFPNPERFLQQRWNSLGKMHSYDKSRPVVENCSNWLSMFVRQNTTLQAISDIAVRSKIVPLKFARAEEMSYWQRARDLRAEHTPYSRAEVGKRLGESVLSQRQALVNLCCHYALGYGTAGFDDSEGGALAAARKVEEKAKNVLQKRLNKVHESVAELLNVFRKIDLYRRIIGFGYRKDVEPSNDFYKFDFEADGPPHEEQVQDGNNENGSSGGGAAVSSAAAAPVVVDDTDAMDVDRDDRFQLWDEYAAHIVQCSFGEKNKKKEPQIDLSTQGCLLSSKIREELTNLMHRKDEELTEMVTENIIGSLQNLEKEDAADLIDEIYELELQDDRYLRS